jgi:hypothetical protein
MKTIHKHSRLMKISSGLFLIIVIAVVWSCSDDGALSIPDDAGANKGKGGATFAAPTVSCVSATQTSITVKVTAGSTGAPAGFSLQWTTKAALDGNNGVWPDDVCKGGFSGNASGYVFNLAAGESSVITIGSALFDTPGASSSCVYDLECGTQYVFRAFAHATSTTNKSAWSANQLCSTDACEENCVYGFGFWKNNGPEGCIPGNSDHVNMFPVSSLQLGSVTYTDVELCSILQKPAAGNGLINLAHQLISAKLNIANGANGSSIATAIADADALIGSLVIPPVGSGTLANSAVGALVTALTAYNEGAGGVSYCPPADEESDN